MTVGTRGMHRVSASVVAKPFGAVGGFYAMALDTLVTIPRRPFAWREFLLQTWFVARVSILPTVMLAIPFAVLMVFTFNAMLIEFGAADLHRRRRRSWNSDAGRPDGDRIGGGGRRRDGNVRGPGRTNDSRGA